MSTLSVRIPLLAAVLVFSATANAQETFDASIDTAWMSARAMLGQDDPQFARELVETLRPIPNYGPRTARFSPKHDAQEFSLQWPLVLRAYVAHTGDTETLRRHVPTDLAVFFDYFRALEDETGLLTAAVAGDRLVHWPEALRDGFDYENGAHAPNAVLNAYYYGALRAGADLLAWAGADATELAARAARVRDAYQQQLIDSTTGLLRDAPSSTNTSLQANALAAAFGLVTAQSAPAVADYLRTSFAGSTRYWQPYIVEGLYQLGYPVEAMTAQTQYAAQTRSVSLDFLTMRYPLGLHAKLPGYEHVFLEPMLEQAQLPSTRFEITAQDRRTSIAADPKTGIKLTVSPETRVEIENHARIPIMTDAAVSHRRDPLDETLRARLKSMQWSERVGDKRGLWIDVDTQMLRLIEGDRVIFQARCATAEKGVGSLMNSLQTPAGWHSVERKIGDDAPWGQVFRARRPTREIWKPGDDTVEDLVLTRVILLTGEEPGKNKGGNVDSLARHIYIHGTNDEARIGTPSSHGCVRLRNDDVIDLYPMVEAGLPVLISAEGHMGPPES